MTVTIPIWSLAVIAVLLLLFAIELGNLYRDRRDLRRRAFSAEMTLTNAAWESRLGAEMSAARTVPVAIGEVQRLRNVEAVVVKWAKANRPDFMTIRGRHDRG